MVCNDVKRIAYFYLDGALSEQKLNEVQLHLEECRDCDGRVTIHRRLRDFVKRRVHQSAPEQLRERLTNLWKGTRPDFSQA